jgi:cytochrome c
MNISHLAAAFALTVSTAAFAADDGAALFQRHNCGACHAAAGKSVGPSLADIAARYQGDKGAQAKLEAKVRRGGAGAFGAIPMPVTARSVSDADISTMAAWVLGRK